MRVATFSIKTESLTIFYALKFWSCTHVFPVCSKYNSNVLVLKPVASILEIPLKNIFANQLLFGDSGEFLGFDENEPTSRSGGKPVAVQQIREVCLIVLPYNDFILQRISYKPLILR